MKIERWFSSTQILFSLFTWLSWSTLYQYQILYITLPSNDYILFNEDLLLKMYHVKTRRRAGKYNTNVWSSLHNCKFIFLFSEPTPSISWTATTGMKEQLQALGRDSEHLYTRAWGSTDLVIPTEMRNTHCLQPQPTHPKTIRWRIDVTEVQLVRGAFKGFMVGRLWV
jgi:hypothetical protein